MYLHDYDFDAARRAWAEHLVAALERAGWSGHIGPVRTASVPLDCQDKVIALTAGVVLRIRPDEYERVRRAASASPLGISLADLIPRPGNGTRSDD